MSYFANIPRINPPIGQPTINPNFQPRAPTPLIPNLSLPRTGINLLNPNVARSLLGANQPANLGNDLQPTMINQPPNIHYQSDVYYPQAYPQATPQPQVVVQTSELPSWLLPLGLIAIGGIVLYALVKK